jgi:chromate transporter
MALFILRQAPAASQPRLCRTALGRFPFMQRVAGLASQLFVRKLQKLEFAARIAVRAREFDQLRRPRLLEPPDIKQTHPEHASLAAVSIAFLKVSLYGIGGGGGLVWARRITVDQQRWISEQDFADIVSLCQFMPGPNIVGIAVCVGTRLRGAIGAVVAVSGFLLIPWTIGFIVGVLCLQHAQNPVLQHILGGISAAAAGLLVATGLRMMLPHRGSPAAVIFASFGFLLMALAKLPLLIVLIGLAPLSIAAAGFQIARAR